MSILDTTGNEIRIVPLGAGQDVGRSCIIATVGGKNIMLDCGMHMGFQDERRFPDFTYITDKCPLDDFIDCVLISHFHLDHCGALPYMTEMVKYKGPIIMTPPTKAITPILLEDYRKVQVQYKGDTNFFTSEMIRECTAKVTCIALHETIHVDAELEVKCYYAGHVLGAAMFLIRANGQSLLYTGDYNMTPDRHLGAAKIDCCFPDVLITESTYATTIRDSKRCRERDFLLKVHECVKRGGKVLIPVFALGRAQELCILLDTYWERMQIKVPIYFTLGLTERATNYYKLFITWTNEKVRETFVEFNMFDFKHISAFQPSLLDNAADKPMVVFATPGMLHGGTSLTIFKRWASDPKNMIIMPGYCTQGTVGARILNGEKTIEFEHKQIVEVKLEVEYMSFSAHADAKGIMQLVQNCQPKHVVLVHGEAEKMKFLSERIETEMSLPCYYPANGQCLTVESDRRMPALITNSFLSSLRAKYEQYFFMQIASEMRRSTATVDSGNNKSAAKNEDAGDAGAMNRQNKLVDFYPVEGVFIMARGTSDGRQRLYIFDRDSAAVRLNALSVALSSSSNAAANTTDSGRSPASTAFSDDDDITRKILANSVYNQPTSTKRHKFSLRSTLALPQLPHLLRDELFERAQYAVSDVIPFADVKISDSKTTMTVRSVEATVTAVASQFVVVPVSSSASDVTVRDNKNTGCSVEFEWLCEDEDIIDDVVDAVEQAAAQCLQQ